MNSPPVICETRLRDINMLALPHAKPRCHSNTRSDVSLFKIGPPHEHKGPEDFNGKRDDEDEDEEDATPAPEDLRAPSQNPQMMAMPAHPGFQHVNHAPSASPPIHNGIPFDPRHGTPQPQGASRPSSRNHLRRVSSNLGGGPHLGTPPPPPPPQNNFSYMPNPTVYNPNAPHSMGQQAPRPPPQFAHFGHHPQGPHQQPPPPPQHQPMPPHSMPQQSMPAQPIPQHPQPHPQHHPHHPSHHALAQPPSTMAMHPPMPHVNQPYLAGQQHSQAQRTTSLPETSSDQIPTLKTEKAQSPPTIKPLSKSKSIFTPIDDHGSMLARNFFGFGESTSAKMESIQHEPEEQKPPHSHSPPPRAKTSTPLSKNVSDIKPPVRTNSGQLGSKRPQLKVQIPSESSDRGSATAESSSSAGQKAATPVKGSLDPSHPGVVLPPPSPSAGAIHSAGAQGPPNPFARPPPPVTAAAAAQNNNAYNNNNNIETPISALPSRFVSDALLPSPSSFFPAEWGFGRSGPDSNILPSPLVFPTPQVQTGPGFGREEEQEKKRKSPESGPSGEGATKKAKT